MRTAVLGSPIAHSLSPVLHNAAYAALGLEGWHYSAHECREHELAAFIDGLDPDWAGFSLTMPLKRAALEVAEVVSPLAAAIGAANTLVLTGDRRFVDNTDVAGIVGALCSTTERSTTGRSTTGPQVSGPPVSGRAVVLGAGGTAQAALAALRDLGVEEVDVLVRDPGRADDLRAAAARLGCSPTITAALGDARAATPFIDGAGVVISTLPAGAADGLSGAAAVVLDVVYAPWPTRFAATSAATGARIVSGLDMLLHQAVAQVELMTGRPGPVEAMRTALAAAVTARPSGSRRAPC